jgi:hypothetical protein
VLTRRRWCGWTVLWTSRLLSIFVAYSEAKRCTTRCSQRPPLRAWSTVCRCQPGDYPFPGIGTMPRGPRYYFCADHISFADTMHVLPDSPPPAAGFPSVVIAAADGSMPRWARVRKTVYVRRQGAVDSAFQSAVADARLELRPWCASGLANPAAKRGVMVTACVLPACGRDLILSRRHG